MEAEAVEAIEADMKIDRFHNPCIQQILNAYLFKIGVFDLKRDNFIVEKSLSERRDAVVDELFRGGVWGCGSFGGRIFVLPIQFI